MKKQTAKSKKNPVPIQKKDPKKVLAGKARAAKAIRIGGKYASKEFIEQLKQDADLAGVPEKNIYQFFLQNEKEYTANAQSFKLTTTRNYEQIITDLRGYKGQIIYNGRKVLKSTAIRNLSMLNNYFKTEHDFYKWWVRYEKKINGQIRLSVPTIKQIEKHIEEGGELEEILEENDLEFIQNTNGQEVKNKKEKIAIEIEPDAPIIKVVKKLKKKTTKKLKNDKTLQSRKVYVERKKRKQPDSPVKKNKKPIQIDRNKLHGKNRKPKL